MRCKYGYFKEESKRWAARFQKNRSKTNLTPLYAFNISYFTFSLKLLQVETLLPRLFYRAVRFNIKLENICFFIKPRILINRCFAKLFFSLVKLSKKVVFSSVLKLALGNEQLSVK